MRNETVEVASASPGRSGLWRRLVLLALIAALVAAFFALGLQHELTLSTLKGRHAALEAYRAAHPLTLATVFFGVYVLVTALSLPGAALMTLALGATFGLWEGVLLASFASSIGATLAFLVSRYLLRDWVRSRFGKRMEGIDRGMVKQGAFYLFTLRLVPVVPFFLINLGMGLTPLPIRRFYWVSQLGMLAGTAVYVNAGTQLAQITSPAGIVSPGLLLAFALLGVFPLIARWIVARVQTARVYRRFAKPRRFDRNLVVIGAGAAGLVSAYIAAAVKARVTLVEGRRMGGDCLNFGCVPSKALIRAAHAVAEGRDAGRLGVHFAAPRVDFAAVMGQVHHAIDTIAPHDSVERYEKLGVDVRHGHAKIVSPWVVEIDGQPITTRAIVIAAGAEPFVPPLPGLEAVGYLTSDTLWQLTEAPRRLAIMGGGPIGCELAQAFARLGVEVTQVEMADRLLLREDDEVSAFVRARLESEGVRVLIDHKAVAVESGADGHALVCEHGDKNVRVVFDRILVAVGRKARLTGYGLEELGIPAQRTVETDDYLATLYPNIYACGDVAGPYQFTHAGAHQAWYAAVNALFGTFKRFKADYLVMPAVTFIDPEVARVGINECEAREAGTAFEVTRYDLAELDRALIEGQSEGWVKVLTVPGKDRILGVTIVGAHAGELLAEFALAMRHGLGLNKILSTVHAYPTWVEANKYTAGEWKRTHTPQRLLAWVARYHAWRRGGAAEVAR